jgi:hypothetical protein
MKNSKRFRIGWFCDIFAFLPVLQKISFESLCNNFVVNVRISLNGFVILLAIFDVSDTNRFVIIGPVFQKPCCTHPWPLSNGGSRLSPGRLGRKGNRFERGTRGGGGAPPRYRTLTNTKDV